MASDAQQVEAWAGGEVLFAGGTDWAKVCVIARTPGASHLARRKVLGIDAQIARGTGSKKQSDQEKLVMK